jgi:hypothetical protein
MVFPTTTWDDAGWNDADRIFELDGGEEHQAAIVLSGVGGSGDGMGASLGDLDGDGAGEVSIGLCNRSVGTSVPGGIGLFLDLEREVLTTPISMEGEDATVLIEGSSDVTALGDTRPVACDVTADGQADLVVSNVWASHTAGAVGVWDDLSSPPATIEFEELPHIVTGGGVTSTIGEALFAGGDVNGDGYSEVGASFESGGLSELAVLSGDALREATAATTSEAGMVLARVLLEQAVDSGWPVVSAALDRDLNADGFADVVAGARAVEAEQGEGAVAVWYGRPDWTASELTLDAADAILYGPEDGRLGYSGVAAGDVTGDGLADLLLGAPTCGSAAEGWGCLYVLDPLRSW